MMLRPVLVVSLFLVALPVEGYSVVLRSGKTIRATGPIRYEGGKAIFPLVGGGIGFVPANQVDRRQTESRNQGQPGYAWKYHEVPRSPERTPEPFPPPHPPLGLFYPGGLTKDCYDDEDLPGKENLVDEERQVEMEPVQISAPERFTSRDGVMDGGLQSAGVTKESEELPATPLGLIPIDPPVLHARAVAKVETADRSSSR